MDLAVALTVGLVGLTLSARSHRRRWPLGLGALGASAALGERFVELGMLLYGGMVLLVAATAGNLWARRHPWMPLVRIRLKRGA